MMDKREEPGEKKGFKSGFCLLGESSEPGPLVPPDPGQRSAFCGGAMCRHALLALLFMTCIPTAKALPMESERDTAGG